MPDYERLYKELQDELDRKRFEEDRRREDEYRERKNRRQEMLMLARQAECEAWGWADAFPKAITRLRRESMYETPENNAEYRHDYYFTKQTEEHEFAHEAWQEETAAVQDRIRRIRERAERMIAALEQQARDKAAARVDKHFGRETEVAQNLRDDDYTSLVNW